MTKERHLLTENIGIYTEAAVWPTLCLNIQELTDSSLKMSLHENWLQNMKYYQNYHIQEENTMVIMNV